MKSKFAAFILLFATVFVLASCLGSNDDYTYTDDTAISAFSVTTAKQRKYVKTSDGKRDSLVIDELTLSSYKFYIDQISGKIYNEDSLPCGVDASKLLCSATASSGAVLIKKPTSDSLDYFSSSDSIDFTSVRQLQVISNSGMALRKYDVEVRVHKEQADSFEWHASAQCEALKALAAVKAVAVGSKVLLLGTNGSNTLVFAHDGNSWSKCDVTLDGTTHALAAEAYKGVVSKGDSAYVSDGGNIICSADGSKWATMGTATGVTRLVAASRHRLFGYAADGRLMASADKGATWTVATIDDEQSLLPDGETAYTATAVDGYHNTDRVTLLGTRRSVADKNMTIWAKIDEWDKYSEDQAWAYYPVSKDNRYAAPSLTSLSAVAYDDAIYMLGTKSGDSEPSFYKSLDNGITWHVDTATVVLPTEFNQNTSGSTSFALAVDKDKSLWLVNAKNGMTWRGRINRLGWKKHQTAFEE